jgi:calpain-7
MRDEHGPYLLFKQNHESQVRTAATKDEALKQALAAAEKLMKAVKLTTNPTEKKQLNQRFNAIADVARSVKINEWTPPKPAVTTPSQPQPESQQKVASRPKSKADGIGEWAASVAQSFEHIPSGPHASTSSTQNASSETKVATQSTPPQSKLRRASPSHPLLATPARENAHYENVRVDHSQGGTSHTQVDLAAQDDLGSRLQEITQKGLPPTGPKTSVHHVRKLREPISSRKRTRKEEIILLKASLVNGVKCPPWDKIPSVDEFALNGSGFFTYVHLHFPTTKQLQKCEVVLNNPC